MKRLSIFSIAIIVILSVFAGCSQKQGPNISDEKVREYANALYNRELYPQAVAEYQRYLDLYDVDETQRANIHFIIGNIYFDRLHDYENAMAHYLKVKHVFPDSQILPQVDKQIIACLERLDRSADAKQALDEATSLEPDAAPKSLPGTVVARIGDREITTGDLAHHIGQLPDYVRSQVADPKAKTEFLRQLVATELFYDAAKRKGLESDKDVVEGAFQARKSLMVQKYLQDEIASQIHIEDNDISLFYEAHKDRYTEKDEKGAVKRQKSLAEVRKTVAEDLLRERQQQAYEALIQRMMRTEKVEIYDDLVR